MGMKKDPENFIEITQEINGTEPILSKICIAENVILHYKTCYADLSIFSINSLSLIPP
jgi:hypothetical protein